MEEIMCKVFEKDELVYRDMSMLIALLPYWDCQDAFPMYELKFITFERNCLE